MENNDIFSFTVNLIMDGLRKTIQEYNRKNDTAINEELFIATTYKNIYDLGNQEIDKKRNEDN